MYKRYPVYKILLRRIGVIIIGTLVLPVMIFRHDKGRFYSYLHRVWSKTSDKPVWLDSSEGSNQDFY